MRVAPNWDCSPCGTLTRSTTRIPKADQDQGRARCHGLSYGPPQVLHMPVCRGRRPGLSGRRARTDLVLVVGGGGAAVIAHAHLDGQDVHVVEVDVVRGSAAGTGDEAGQGQGGGGEDGSNGHNSPRVGFRCVPMSAHRLTPFPVCGAPFICDIPQVPEPC